MQGTFETRLLRFIDRHVVHVLTLLYLVPMAWGGLVPFDFSLATHGPAAQAWLGLPVSQSPTTDLIANIVLYIPMGLLLRASLVRLGIGRFASMFVTMAAAGVFSYVTEWIQLFSPSRFCSASDFQCNLLGSFLGMTLVSVGSLAGRTISHMVRSFGVTVMLKVRQEIEHRPAMMAARFCACVLFLAAVAPGDVTFSLNRVFASVKDANFVPFGRDARLSHTVWDGPAESNRLAHFAGERERWHVFLDYCWQTAGYALLGGLIAYSLLCYCLVGGAKRTVWTVAACGLLALFSGGAQVFIISRSFDITDVLLALTGGLIGAWLMAPVADQWTDVRRIGRHKLIVGALAGWCVMLAARELVPFSFVFTIDSIGRQVYAAEWVPMQSYQKTLLPIALDDFVTKAARYVGLGVLFALWRLSRGVSDTQPHPLRMTLQLSSAVAGLEILQLFLPSRTPATTDVLVAAVGICTGVVIFRLLKTCLDDFDAEQAAARRVVYNVEFGTDFPAPHEPAHTQQPSTAETEPRP